MILHKKSQSLLFANHTLKKKSILLLYRNIINHHYNPHHHHYSSSSSFHTNLITQTTKTTQEEEEPILKPKRSSEKKRTYSSLSSTIDNTTETISETGTDTATTATTDKKKTINNKTQTTNTEQSNLDRYGIHRFPLAWKDPNFYNEEKLENEMRRIFELCHGCRRCFNLCDSFPTLFDLIDYSKNESLESVHSNEFKKVVDKCTLCDLCYASKCPYIPPHEFNIDFPHLMLRYKTVEQYYENTLNNNLTNKEMDNKLNDNDTTVKETTGFLNQPGIEYKAKVNDGVNRKLLLKKENFIRNELLTKIDRNGWIFTKLPTFLTNFLFENKLIRKILDQIGFIHKDAHLPSYSHGTALDLINKNVKNNNQFDYNQLAQKEELKDVIENKLKDEKIVIYTTCLGNYNKPELVQYSKEILEKNGINVIVDYYGCCQMPQFEQGQLQKVSESAQKISKYLNDKYIKNGFKIVTVVPSCSLMLKSEWSNILPTNEDVQQVKKFTMDITEYLIYLVKKNGGKLPTQNLIKELPYSTVTLHHACHARAQNIGNKGLEVLKLIPKLKVNVIQRCSGHGGSFGVKKEHFETALKVGKPVAQKIQSSLKKDPLHVISSECPLAGQHLSQSVGMLNSNNNTSSSENNNQQQQQVVPSKHPIEILAEAYHIKL
ncbi:hypothetical protein ABK040_004002 [Willaertia magna]